MTIGGGGIATTPYMSAATGYHPQYSNQHLGQYTAQNHPYMQQSNAVATAYYTGNANAGTTANNNNQANSPNNTSNGAKYQNQPSDKK